MSVEILFRNFTISAMAKLAITALTVRTWPFMNMILTVTGYGLGTLWIANTCFAYNELIEFIGTDNQLTGIVAVGAANEAPPKRPRKALRDVVEYR